MAESETPMFVYQEVFQQFQTFAKDILAHKAEPAALILVTPWEFDAPFPPGAIVTRSGQLTPRELLTCARQLRVMSERLYTLLASTLEAGLEESNRRAKDGPPVERRQALEQEGTQKDQEIGSLYAPGTK
jgi:hypothetical protein